MDVTWHLPRLLIQQLNVTTVFQRQHITVAGIWNVLRLLCDIQLVASSIVYVSVSAPKEQHEPEKCMENEEPLRFVVAEMKQCFSSSLTESKQQEKNEGEKNELLISFVYLLFSTSVFIFWSARPCRFNICSINYYCHVIYWQF